MKILHLTVKKKWFDMILSGEKKEEYREMKEYWRIRLLGFKDEIESQIIEEFENDIKNNKMSITDIFSHFKAKFKEYDVVKFTNGYGKDKPALTVEFNGIFIGRGYRCWGAIFGETYYCIKLGKILERFNV